LDVMGDIPWGTHSGLLYRDCGDIAELLIPCFKTGLESNEYGLWITSDPMDVAQAQKALKAAVPEFERYLGKAQIEIIPYNELHIQQNVFDTKGTINLMMGRLDQALKGGYSGMRIAGNAGRIKEREWGGGRSPNMRKRSTPSCRLGECSPYALIRSIGAGRTR